MADRFQLHVFQGWPGMSKQKAILRALNRLEDDQHPVHVDVMRSSEGGTRVDVYFENRPQPEV